MSKGPATRAARQYQVETLCKAVDTICDAWPIALEAAESRGFRSSSGRGPLLRIDANGNLIDPSEAEDFGYGHVADPTGMLALISDKAEGWLKESGQVFALTLRITSTEAPGERKWTGPYWPPSQRETLKLSVADLVEMWPVRIDKLFKRLISLAGMAAKEWPPTPKAGDVVDGVTVGKRHVDLELCVECGKPATGDAADPIVRIDGKPYHRRPCYMAAHVRIKRAAIKVLPATGDVALAAEQG